MVWRDDKVDSMPMIRVVPNGFKQRRDRIIHILQFLRQKLELDSYVERLLSRTTEPLVDKVNSCQCIQLRYAADKQGHRAPELRYCPGYIPPGPANSSEKEWRC